MSTNSLVSSDQLLALGYQMADLLEANIAGQPQRMVLKKEAQAAAEDPEIAKINDQIQRLSPVSHATSSQSPLSEEEAGWCHERVRLLTSPDLLPTFYIEETIRGIEYTVCQRCDPVMKESSRALLYRLSQIKPMDDAFDLSKAVLQPQNQGSTSSE